MTIAIIASLVFRKTAAAVCVSKNLNFPNTPFCLICKCSLWLPYKEKALLYNSNASYVVETARRSFKKIKEKI